MKICPVCKAEYSNENEFCQKCGSKLEIKQESSIAPSDYAEGY